MMMGKANSMARVPTGGGGAILAMALLVMMLVAPAASTEAGDIFITGHDIDGHGTAPYLGQDGFDTVVLDYLRGGLPANRANYRIALIGTVSGSGTIPTNWGAFAAGYTDLTYYSTTDLDTGAAGPNLDRDWGWVLDPINTDCLIILSHNTAGGESITCPFDDPINNGVDSLFARKADINGAFNAGLDLFVLTGADCAAAGVHGSLHAPPYYYDFLAPDFVVPGTTIFTSNGFFITNDGCNIGLEGSSPNQCGTLPMVNAITHSHFGPVGNGGLCPDPPTYFGPLAVMETWDQSGLPSNADGDPCEFVISLAGIDLTFPDPCPDFTDSTHLNHQAEDVAIGDIDLDGYLDAVTAGYWDPGMVVRNQGLLQPGVFTIPGQYMDTMTIGLDLGDVDDDDDLDIFFARGDTGFTPQPNTVWINDGFGNFTDSGQSLGNSYSNDVTLGDLDDDGDLDAFVVNGDYGGVYTANKVWINQGGLQAGTPGVFLDSGQSLGASESTECVLGDLDCDGDLDAIVVNLQQNEPNKVWFNIDGLGTFVDSGMSLGSTYSTGVALGDVDGDEDLDVYVTNWLSQLIGDNDVIWENDGSGIFTDSGQNLGGITADNLHLNVALGDLDCDDDLDAFVVSGSGEPNIVWINQGEDQGGTAGEFIDSGQTNLGLFESHNAVSLGDFDNDGDLDAISFGAKGRVYLNNGCSCDPVPCANIDEDTETIFCIPVEQGSYQYSIDIINKSDFDVVKVLIPDVTDGNGAVLVDVEPNVVDYSPDSYGTSDALPTLELTLNPVPGSGYDAGEFIPLMIGLMAKDDDGTIFQCCAIDREVELPVCCNELKNYTFGEFDSGCVELTLEFTNLDQMAPVEAFHAFLLGLSPASMTFDPDYFALPGGVLDNSPGTLTTTICGVSPGDTIEFELIIHSENLEECCNQLHTIDVAGQLMIEIFIRGDTNRDGGCDIADAIHLMDFLFNNGPCSCLDACDVNDDGMIDIADVIYKLGNIFQNQPPPPSPYPGCGTDPTADTLDCASFPPCP